MSTDNLEFYCQGYQDAYQTLIKYIFIKLNSECKIELLANINHAARNQFNAFYGFEKEKYRNLNDSQFLIEGDND